MPAKAPPDEVKRVISLALDAAFYRGVYGDMAAEGDVLWHYAVAGWREGRDPAPWFSTRRYLAANADVVRAGAEPLHHYLTRGRYEGRDVYPSELAEGWFAHRRANGGIVGWSLEALIAPAPPPQMKAPPAPAPEPSVPSPAPAAAEGPAHADRVAAEFDASFYLAANPDVATAGADPVWHFMVAGWREGRDPAPWFSVRDYLETYPDVAAAGENPFVHFLLAGRSEGRRPKHDLGFRYDILAKLVPVEARLAAAVQATAAEPLGTAKALAAALAQSRSGLSDLHLSFSHDDYTSNLGGMQLCLQREAAAFARLGRDHLHLFPRRAWPVVRAADEPGALGVVFNGEPAGTYAPKTILQVLAKAAAAAPVGRRSFAIHSLLGHNAAETAKLVGAVGLSAGVFWLHDFASLCAGFHLLRDDVEDCAAPPPDSTACSICAYGPLRARHLAEHEKLFKALALTVVSPSQSALDLWRASWDFAAKNVRVAPHVRLVERGAAPAPRGPFRLAFAGIAAPYKGLPVFQALAERFKEDPRYQFIHLASREAPGLAARFRPVSVTADTPRAMTEALAEVRADAVLVWPLCRETFSFIAHEAVAAGAAVVTNPDSGNVAVFVEETGHGRVVADEASLMALFESGEIRALSRARRKARLYDLEFSDMTAELPHPEAAA